MLLASAFRRARQGSNPFYDFQAPGAAYIDASAAARAFVGDNDRQPLELHRCLPSSLAAAIQDSQFVLTSR